MQRSGVTILPRIAAPVRPATPGDGRLCRTGSLQLLQVLGCIVSLLLSDPALALSRQDSLVIVRAISMLSPRPDGAVVALVYPAGDSDAESEARTAAEMMLGLGLSGAAVDSSRISTDMARYTAIVLPADRQVAGAVAALARTEGILTIGLGDDCLTLPDCMLAVSTTPAVSITLAREVADSAGIRFTPAFTLMVRQR